PAKPLAKLPPRAPFRGIDPSRSPPDAWSRGAVRTAPGTFLKFKRGKHHGRSTVRRPCGSHTIPAQPVGRRSNAPALRAPPAQDPVVLPAPARQPRGSRGCDADHVSERLSRAEARHVTRVRVGVALQDRAQRL